MTFVLYRSDPSPPVTPLRQQFDRDRYQIKRGITRNMRRIAAKAKRRGA